jgi:hypothetical protein
MFRDGERITKCERFDAEYGMTPEFEPRWSWTADRPAREQSALDSLRGHPQTPEPVGALSGDFTARADRRAKF